MDQFINKLKKDYPDIKFRAAKQFSWSPVTQEVLYATGNNKTGRWSVLHELSHALLEHNSYMYDYELIQLEMEAWEKAQKIAANYQQVIDEEHIQNCLDTYKDWLFRRCRCPVCETQGIQDKPTLYRCFNCHAIWHVTASRFCRPYRQLDKYKKTAFY
jgi:hypothetical protein